MPSTTDTDIVYLYLYVMEVMEKMSLEGNIVGTTSGGGGNLQVGREAMKSKYTNDSVFCHPRPYLP